MVNICYFLTRRFKHKNPEDPNEVPGGFISDCRTDTLKVLKAYADVSIKGAKVYDKFQFERIGFFSVDPDANDANVSFPYLPKHAYNWSIISSGYIILAAILTWWKSITKI